MKPPAVTIDDMGGVEIDLTDDETASGMDFFSFAVGTAREQFDTPAPGVVYCHRCGNKTSGLREGGIEYCTCCGGELR